MAKRDFYEILGVPRDADDGALKSAFRKLAMQLHPDKNPGDAAAEGRFKEINQAYEILKDPQKRAAYDRFGHQAFEQGGGAGAGAAGFSSFADIFDEFFGDLRGGAAGQRRSGRERGSDLRYNLEITLEDAFAGKTVDGRRPHLGHLRRVHRHRLQARLKPEDLRHLQRPGPRPRFPGRLLPHRAHLPDLPRPRRGGAATRAPNAPAPAASRRTARCPVNIPAGIEDGTRIRLAGEGEAGLRGGPAGDLYIFLSIKPHAFFQRDGADIFCRVPVSITTAALGGEFEVPTVDGSRTRVKVTEGAQSGKQFRLKGKGMPVLRSRQSGDMYVQIVVETPQNLSRRQRELLQEFERASNAQNNPESTGFFSR
jgi:molecular chaperone DnaJ